MKKRPIQLLVCLAMALPLTHLHSQPPPPGKPPAPEERVKHVSEKIEKEISLSAAQKEKIKMAYKEFFTSIEELRKKRNNNGAPPPPPPPPGKKEDMDKLAVVRDEKIKSVLNAAQYKKYQEIEKSLRPPVPAGPPPMK